MELINSDHKALIKLVKFYEEQHKKRDLSFFDADDLNQIIDYYISRKEIGKALKCTGKALELFSNDSRLIIKGVRLYIDSFDYETAFDVLEKSELSMRTNPDFWIIYAEACAAEGDYDAAIDYLKTAIEYSSSSVSVIHFKLAQAFAELQDNEHAFNYYRKALREQPENQEFLLHFADFCENTKWENELILFFERLVNKEPYSHILWNNLAILYHYFEQNEEAFRAIDISLALKEDNAETHFLLADFKSENRDYHEAVTSYLTAIKYGKSDLIVYLQLGLTCIQIGEYDDADHFLRKGIELDPADSQCWYALGLCYASRELYKTAIPFYEKAISLFEYDDRFWHELAISYSCIENFAKATTSFQQAIDINPFNTDAVIDYCLFLHDHHKTEDAIYQALEALGISEDIDQIQYLLAGLYFGSGESDIAKKHLKEALLTNPSNTEYFFEFFPELKENPSVCSLVNQFDIITGDFTK